MEEAIKKADVLIEALPYIKQFHKKIAVFKYGGSILGEERVRKSVLEDIAFLRYTGICPILVHGGGPNITERLRDMKVNSEFYEGFRVTDEKTLGIVEEELNKLNDVIVQEISSHGIIARGFKGADGIFTARKKKSKKDLGFVGEAVGINKEKILETLPQAIPVICPMGVSADGQYYNINADEAAAFLAASLRAEKIVFLTNVRGVMHDPADQDSLLSTLSVEDAQQLVTRKVIDEGMIPKVKAAIHAIKEGVEKAHIVDAKVPHAILLEIFTDMGIGTEIVHE
ncbi:MAG: acetylglutamate kinase [Candidatus Omnitrophica bacterium]|nr:acetylglutamate kinase [Candidatus Omnitrophota bacterium]